MSNKLLYKRVVVKVGSRILSTEDGNIDKKQFASITKQIAELKKQNIQVILVSSGSVALGSKILNLKAKPKTLPEKQAAASIGQSALMNIYNTYFAKKGLSTGQVLLTYEDFKDRRRYLNAYNTIEKLLAYDVIPIINENDTVSVDELNFGDNDRLASLTTNLMKAELLILLSAVDGLYKNKEDQTVIKEVKRIDASITKTIYAETHWATTGGMASKLEAVKLATTAGETVVLANGRKAGVITAIANGKNIGTKFLPQQDKKMQSRKRWIAFLSKTKGEIKIDDGAANALISKGKSLLPSGIQKVNGIFKPGDAVSVLDLKGKEIARGLVNYNQTDTDKIKGLNTSQIEKTLGTCDYTEVIHRNNLVILKEGA